MAGKSNGVPEGFELLDEGTNCEFYNYDGKLWIRVDPEQRPGGGGGKNPRVATSHGFVRTKHAGGAVRSSLNVIA